MATAKAGPRRSTRDITLTLTEGEADLLLSLLANVSGSSTKSPRKYAERIRDALIGALGYTYKDTDAHALLFKDSEGVYYHDYGTGPHPEDDDAETSSDTDGTDALLEGFCYLGSMVLELHL